MERCLTSLNIIIREMQNKTIVEGYLFRSIRMTQMENIDNVKCWQGCGATVTIILLTGMQNSTAILETFEQFCMKLNTHLT